MQHFVNGGKNEKYAGLHLWNIDLYGNNDCLIWNPDTRFLLSDYFKGFASVKKREMDYETEEMIVSISPQK